MATQHPGIYAYPQGGLTPFTVTITPPEAPPSPRLTWKQWIMKFATIIFGVCFFGYVLALAVYSCFLGGTAAHLVTEYYKYSVPTSFNSTARQAIDSFPRDIYHDTKVTAILYLGGGIAAGLCLILSDVGLCLKHSDMFWKWVTWGNVSTVIFPMLYGIFLAWKVHDLSAEDILAWDGVDPQFLNTMRLAERFMIGLWVTVPLWTVFGLILWRKNYYSVEWCDVCEWCEDH